jgi:hypothetical protein
MTFSLASSKTWETWAILYYKQIDDVRPLDFQNSSAMQFLCFVAPPPNYLRPRFGGGDLESL